MTTNGAAGLRPSPAGAPAGAPLRIQLWSYNYDPEPTGIGPVSATLAIELQNRGHHISVVAAHPHYPEPRWGSRARPYREIRAGVPVLRLPLIIGRATVAERFRQELSYMLSLAAALPLLGRPDIIMAVSPSFPALLPTVIGTTAKRVPWVLWLQDILPDGAAATGLIADGLVLRASRWLERTAYRSADQIVVPSGAFTAHLTAKGIPSSKVTLVYDPATRAPRRPLAARRNATPPSLLSMGNIGLSQGLATLVAAFEADERMARLGAQLAITGNGVAADEARAQIKSDRVQMLGMVPDHRLEAELAHANLGLVTQHHDGTEFNIPSKLMNFMLYGLPILAAVNPSSEVARIVRDAACGWVVDSSHPASLPDTIAAIADDPLEVERRANAALAYARQHFAVDRFGELYERTLVEVAARARLNSSRRPRLRLSGALRSRS